MAKDNAKQAATNAAGANGADSLNVENLGDIVLPEVNDTNNNNIVDSEENGEDTQDEAEAKRLLDEAKAAAQKAKEKKDSLTGAVNAEEKAKLDELIEKATKAKEAATQAVNGLSNEVKKNEYIAELNSIEIPESVVVNDTTVNDANNNATLDDKEGNNVMPNTGVSSTTGFVGFISSILGLFGLRLKKKEDEE